MAEKEYDVQFKYRHFDRRRVRDIYRELKRRNINPWLDEVDIIPGEIANTEFRKVNNTINTIAIFIGEEGFTPSQAEELKGIVDDCRYRDIRIIPVILHDFEEIPKNLSFLKRFHPVRFHDYDERESAFQRFQLSILDKKAENTQNELDSALQTYLYKAKSKIPRGNRNYNKLIELLENGEFKEASNETDKCFLRCLSKVPGEHYISPEEVSAIPCDVMKIIDYLWLHYSDGDFGLSVQKDIYQSCGGSFEFSYLCSEAWSAFGEKVGWRQEAGWFYDDSEFSSPPRGHYPYGLTFSSKGSLFFRLHRCGL